MRAGITVENPVILGVSFGGIMAIEIAKSMPAARVIIVSSLPNYRLLPLSMKMIGRLKLNKWMPSRRTDWLGFSKWLAPIEDYFLGVETKEEARLCREFKQQVDTCYLQWAVDRILYWKNEWQPPVLYHLHGSKDKIFPLTRLNPMHVIPGGTHFMIYNRAAIISQILKEIVETGI